MNHSDSALLHKINREVGELSSLMKSHVENTNDYGKRITALERKAWYEKGIFAAVGVIFTYFFHKG